MTGSHNKGTLYFQLGAGFGHLNIRTLSQDAGAVGKLFTNSREVLNALRTLTFVISGRADSITKDLLASRVHAHWVAPKQIRHEICQMFYTCKILGFFNFTQKNA